MATQVNPPRGMRDFLPAEKRERERILSVIRQNYRAHGFDEIETPVMEDSDRLHAGLGGDNEKLAFGVLKRALTTDDFARAETALDLTDLGLRFDLTVPLARFYASHRAELPTVFRAIQIAPVWRAERPQKGRYRQFVQCDIDIIGSSDLLAEAELITATLSALDALGLDGCEVRINDRRLLTAMLDTFGFATDEHPAVLITIDKLDKIAATGVVAELRERGFTASAIDAFEQFLRRPQTMEFNFFGEKAIRKALPTLDSPAIADLVALGSSLGDVSKKLVFDPFLVRGMGYYTGTIFEVAHPSAGYSLGGGGRYDGMIGRFLGTDVPAVGFSLGFERIVDLLSEDGVAAHPTDGPPATALLYDADVTPVELIRLQRALIADGNRVRLERRPKNLKVMLDQLVASGFTRYAIVSTGGVGEFKSLGSAGA